MPAMRRESVSLMATARPFSWMASADVLRRHLLSFSSYVLSIDFVILDSGMYSPSATFPSSMSSVYLYVLMVAPDDTGVRAVMPRSFCSFLMPVANLLV